MKGKDLLRESKRINENIKNEKRIRVAMKFAKRVFEEIAPIEIIRCKDCDNWDGECRFCKLHGLDCNGNSLYGEIDFCSLGVRRESLTDEEDGTDNERREAD